MKKMKTILSVDLFIDFEKRKIINVLPYAMHSEGWTYPEMKNMIESGKGILITIDQEDLEFLDKNGWKDIEDIQKSGKEKLDEN